MIVCILTAMFQHRKALMIEICSRCRLESIHFASDQANGCSGGL